MHRDVKPSNVLVRTGPVEFAYLVDFGIARAFDGTKLSLTGAVVGTAAYMAPERFDGEGDHRGDVYALGCVLYETLTAQLAFQAPHLFAYAEVHRTQPPPRSSAVCPDLPPGLDIVIACALAKDPADRYPSAGSLAAAARSALSPLATPSSDTALWPPTAGDRTVRVARPTAAPAAALPTPSRSPPPQPGTPPQPSWSGSWTGATHATAPEGADTRDPALVPATLQRSAVPPAPTRAAASAAASRTPTPNPARRRRTWIGVVLGLVLTVVASTIILIRPGPIVTPRSTAIAEHTLTGTSGVLSVAVAQLDGRPVIVSGGYDLTVRVRDLATGAPIGQPLAGHANTVQSVTTAQLDGRPVIVSGDDDGTVRVWGLATGAPIGQPITSHTDGVRYVFSVAVAELGDRPVIVSGSADGTVRVWDLATGAPIGQPITAHTFGVFSVAVTQLGGRPVIVSGGYDRTVRVWDLATGAPAGQPMIGHTSEVFSVVVAQLDGRPVIVSGSRDMTVRVWDLATGASIGQPLTGHTDWVRSVAVAQLGGRPVIVSGSDDKTVRVWDLASHAPIGQPLTGHTDRVSSVAAAQLDGNPVIVSGSGDNTVRIWDLARRTGS